MAIISKRLWLVSAALASAAVVYSIPASKADIIYDVNLQVGSTGSATGFIRTDGFLGTIPSNGQFHLISGTQLHILDFQLTLNDGTRSVTLNENTTTNPLSAQYENELGVFNELIFTPTQLDFQFHFDSSVPLIDVFGLSGNMSILDFQSGRLGPPNGTGIGLRIGSDPFLTSPMNGGDTVQIGVAVPGPIAGAGLPGLIAACGVLLALARRRLKIASFA